MVSVECLKIIDTVYVLKFQTLLLFFPKKMFVFKAEIHKMLVKKANRADPDQTDSSETV